MATYVGKCNCAICGEPAQVYTDRAGMAYYRCGPCGAHLRQTKATKNRKFLESVDRHIDDDDAPEISREKQEIPAAPAPVTTPEKTGDKPKRNSIFMGL